MKKLRVLLLLLVVLVARGQVTVIQGPPKLPMGSGGGGPATAVDNFTRANADPISNPMSDGVSTWSSPVGASGTTIIFNDAASCSTSGIDGQAEARVASPTFSANQAVTNIIAGGSPFGSECGPCVRMQSGNAGCYILYIADYSTLQLYLTTDDGTQHFTAIGAAFSGLTLNAGDKVVLSVTGSTFSIIVNGTTLGTRSDSTFATGQPGIYTNPSRFIAGFGATSLP